MKTFLILTALLFSYSNATTQNLPEFNDKPAFIDTRTGQLVELEKSQYSTMAKAKGLSSAEAGFFLKGISSSVKISKQAELRFIVKVVPGTDPTSVFDLVQFEIRKDQRVFITTKAKATSTSTSFEKIMFDLKKIKEGYYYLIVLNMDKGEYFFGSQDYMFAFSIE